MEINMNELNNMFKKSAENFLLIPSDKIWENIEAEIRKRERRRRFFIFFFIGAAILTSGIFLFINPFDKQEETQINNPEVIVQDEQQQNTSSIHKYSEKENTIASDVQSERKYSGRNKTIQKENLPTTFISGDKYFSKNVSQKTPGQNESLNNSLEPEITAEVNVTVSPASPDVIEVDSTFAISKDTMETETVKDSLTPVNSEIIVNDTTVLIKDTTKAHFNKSKWSISIGIAPTLSFVETHEKGDYQIISNYRDSSDKTLLTWNYHFTVSYRFIQRMEIFTGIGIINLSQELLSKQAIYRYDTSGIIVGPVPQIFISREYYNINGDSTGSVKNKFSWLEIPIGVRYDFLTGHKFNISLQPEASFNKLINADGYIYNNETLTYEKIKSSDLKSWLVSYGIGLSFRYAFMKNLHLEFTPSYRNFEKSIYQDSYPSGQHLQQVEFRISFRYLIK